MLSYRLMFVPALALVIVLGQVGCSQCSVADCENARSRYSEMQTQQSLQDKPVSATAVKHAQDAAIKACECLGQPKN